MNTFFCRTIRMYKRFNTRIYLACTHGYCSIMGNSPRFQPVHLLCIWKLPGTVWGISSVSGRNCRNCCHDSITSTFMSCSLPYNPAELLSFSKVPILIRWMLILTLCRIKSSCPRILFSNTFMCCFPYISVNSYSFVYTGLAHFLLISGYFTYVQLCQQVFNF